MSYKKLGDDKVYNLALPDYPGYKKNRYNDKALMKDVLNIFNDADVIIAHNGNRFDVLIANTRLVANGLPPPSPFKQVDTLKVARRYFRFPGNSLKALAHFFKLGAKIETSKNLWKGCDAGDMKAWKKMIEYCNNDVVLLEKIYLKLLPWMDNHPWVPSDRGGCDRCGAPTLRKEGTRQTKKGLIQEWSCRKCNKWTRTKL